MFTFRGSWFISLLTSLESLRRGQAGALMIGTFITLDTITPAKMTTTIEQLRLLATITIKLIEELPGPVRWAATPFLDYAKAIN